MRSLLAGLLVLHGLCSLGRALGREPPARAPTATSATGLIVVSGFASPDHAQLAAWCEDIRGRVERHIGSALPDFARQPLRILARADANDARGRVIRAQGWVDGRLVQRLVVINPERADHEDVLEGFCWLLLNRYVVARQTMDERERRLGELPDWFAVGVAQHLYLEPRARNAAAVVERWEQDGGLTLADLLAKEYLPDGRWVEKYASGLLLGWLRELAGHDERMQECFERVARGERITLPWLVDATAAWSSVEAAEAAWKQHVKDQARVARAWGSASLDHIEALKELLVVQPHELPGGHGVPTRPMALGDLLAYRQAAWLPGLLTARRVALHRLAIGRGPEFRAVVDAFSTFMVQLDPRYREVMDDRALVAQLRAAETALAEAERNVRGRANFLDRVEQTLRAGAVPAEVSAFLDAVVAAQP